jgi:hypothetical protein
MKTWYEVTEVPSDVLLEWELAFFPERVTIPETDFRIQQIYQRQRIALCASLHCDDAGRKYLEMFYAVNK